MAADWSILPSDLLCAIASKSDYYEDFIRFSAVCQEWNRASSLVKHQRRAPLPSLLLAENTNENPDCLRKILNLNNKQIYELKLPETFGTRCWGSPYGWVAMAGSNRSVQLFNPITKAQIHFPSFKSLEHYLTAIPEEDLYDDHLFLRAYLTKLIVLKVSRNGHHEFVIMVIYDWQRYLAFARHGDQAWTSVLIKELKWHVSRRVVTHIVDVVARNDDIFVLYGDGAIVHWHSTEFHSGKLLKPTDYYSPSWPPHEMFLRLVHCQTIYLIESRGDLIMVIRHKEEILDKDDRSKMDRDICYRTIDFDVFKFNEHDGWVKIEDLGNVAVFIGGNYSMSIPLGAVQSLKHSGIHFTDDEYEYWTLVREFGGHDMGFYDMKRKEIQFHKGDDLRSLICPPTWFIPEL